MKTYVHLGGDGSLEQLPRKDDGFAEFALADDLAVCAAFLPASASGAASELHPVVQQTPCALVRSIEKAIGHFTEPQKLALVKFLLGSGAKTVQLDAKARVDARALLAKLAMWLVDHLHAAELFRLLLETCLFVAWPTQLGDSSVVLRYIAWLAACAALARHFKSWKPVSFVHTCVDIMVACHSSRAVCLPESEPCDSADGNAELVTRLWSQLFDGAMALPVVLQQHRRPRIAHAEKDVCIECVHVCNSLVDSALIYMLEPIADADVAEPLWSNGAVALLSEFGNYMRLLNPRIESETLNAGGTTMSTMRRRDARIDAISARMHRAQERLWLLMTRPQLCMPSARLPTGEVSTPRPQFYLAQQLGIQRITFNDQEFVWTLAGSGPGTVRAARPHPTDGRARAAAAAAAGAPKMVGQKRSADHLPNPVTKQPTPAEIDLRAELGALADVEEEVRSMLVSSGVVMLRLNNAQLRLVEARSREDYITIDGVSWEEFRNTTTSVPHADWSRATTAGCGTNSLCSPSFFLDPERLEQTLLNVIERTHPSKAALNYVLSQLVLPTVVIKFPRVPNGCERLLWEAWQLCLQLANCTALLLFPCFEEGDVSFRTRSECLDMRISVFTLLSAKLLRLAADDAAIERAQKSAIMSFRDNCHTSLYDHQASALETLCRRVAVDHRRTHFLWMNTGSGKTAVALLHAQFLHELGVLPRPRCLLVVPKSAMAAVCGEADKMGFTTRMLDDATTRKATTFDAEIEVVIVSHDRAKLSAYEVALTDYAAMALVVIDEVHEILGTKTNRVKACTRLAAVAPQALFMTATPLRTMRHRRELYSIMERVTSMPCTTDDQFVVACGATVCPPVRGWIATTAEYVDANTEGTRAELLAKLPTRLGGSSSSERLSQEAAVCALEAAMRVTDQTIANMVVDEIAAGERPFVVCRSFEHCTEMTEQLISAGVPAEEIWCHRPNRRLALDYDSIGKKSKLRCALVPISASAGYSATYFTMRIRGVFPCSEAARRQIDGRLTRRGQKAKSVRLVTVHCGITSFMLTNHIEVGELVRLAERLNDFAPIG